MSLGFRQHDRSNQANKIKCKGKSDSLVRSLTLICASATNLKILVKHTKPPMKKMPFKASFLLKLICSVQIMGIGSARMTRSPTKESTPLVRPITIRALGTQWPGWALFQKKETGVHWRMLEVKAATAQHFEDLRQANGG